MRNPYEVFGLDSSANMDQVKNAYREMARRYSGDADIMRELDEAYDAIVMNGGSYNTSSTYGNTDGYTEYQQTSEFGDIRAKLNSGRIDDAEMLLDGIPIQRRNAEWFYLKGTIQHRRGWLESAGESFRRAHELDPSNPEFEAAFNQLNREKKGTFREERRSTENSGCGDPCKICSGLMCADCCCECMGGDLIRCC